MKGLFKLIILLFPGFLAAQDTLHDNQDNRPYPLPELSKEDSLVHKITKRVGIFENHLRSHETDTLQTNQGERVLMHSDTVTGLVSYRWEVRRKRSHKQLWYYFDKNSKQIVLLKYNFSADLSINAEKYVPPLLVREKHFFHRGKLFVVMNDKGEKLELSEEERLTLDQSDKQYFDFHISCR